MTKDGKKIIIVTGGAGFIGSHLCEALVQDPENKVISLDNYFTGSKDNHIDGVEYREGHTKDIEKLIPETPDIIYHLGEYSRVEQSVLEPELTHNLNTLGTKGVVEFWRKKKCKLVYAGSSTKFGDDGKARYTSPYARSKAENTELVRDTGESENLQYAITYFYNVYGERERSGVYGSVIEHFKKMYLSGAPCAVVSPGTQERNFTHVDDTINALIIVGEKGQGDEYGLGNEQSYSILEVSDMFGFGDHVVMFPPRTGNRTSSSLNRNKILELGWNTKHSLRDYVKIFIDSNKRGDKHEGLVLVFSTTIHPVAGLAENSFVELAEALPEVEFDVITTKFTRKANDAQVIAKNISLHRVGVGLVIDKFLLPILGVFVGFRLLRNKQYLFVWSLMASYAALAGILLKSLIFTPLLITLADQNLDDLSRTRRRILSMMISSADQVYGTHVEQEKSAMHVSGKTLPRNSLGEGDAFANALRYAYSDIVRRRQEV